MHALLPSLPLLALALGAPPTPEQVDWVKKNAIPLKTVHAEQGFDDLSRLKPVIGDARVVGLGEATHGTREHFQMKHRLVEFLVEEMGFTIFSIEANMPESYRLNEYVLEGKGDPAELIRGMYFWTWSTDEVLDMVKWMRRYNEKQAAAGKDVRLTFTGFDMQTPDVAMKIVTDFVRESDKEFVDTLAGTWASVRRNNARGGGGAGFGVTSIIVPAEPLRGKKLKFTGWIKSEGVDSGWAGLWARVNAAQATLFFDNMMTRGVHGTTDWQQYEVMIDVADSAEVIQIGSLITGAGSAWFDDFALSVDDKPYVVDSLDDWSFEKPGLSLQQRGFAREHQDPSLGVYEISHESDAAHSGKQSLKLRRTDDAADPAAGLQAAKEVVDHLSGARARYAAAGRTAKDIDWAIQNGRVVSQYAEMATDNGFVIRDRSMAANVQWILDQNPGAKIVLWAHNGHIARDTFWMGNHLGKALGKDYVPIGFTATSGEYTAQGSGKLGSHPLLAPPDNSVESIFAGAGMPIFALDLRSATKDSPENGWARGQTMIRSIGALAQDEQFFEIVPANYYDVLIYTEATTAAVQLPR